MSPKLFRTPGAFTIVPGAFFNGVAVRAIGRNSQVCGLIPLVAPVVSRRVGIHAA